MKPHWFLFIFAIFCTTLSAAKDQKYYAAVGIETFVLENGIRVALKPTSNESNEVLVRLMAVGGVAELPIGERTAGRISAQAAVRSGLSGFGFDKMQAMLYDHSIEFDVQMQPFSRSIELSADSDELNHVFELVNGFFTKSRFSCKAYEAHKKALLKTIRCRGGNSICQFEDACMKFNMHPLGLSPVLHLNDVQSASFEDSKRFFKRCFVNPGDFVCVIVGDFDRSTVKQGVKKYLASIPKGEGAASPKIPPLPNFPGGVRTKVIRKSNRTQALTLMTFPLHVEVNQENLRKLEVMSCLIQERLMKNVDRNANSLLELSASLDFPYYPSFHSPRLTIRFISEPKRVSSVGQSVLDELKKMQLEGFDQKEVEIVKLAAASSDHLSNMENYCWLTEITNYMIWGWDLNLLKKDYETGDYWSKDEAGKNVLKAVSLDHYSIISLQP